MVSKVNTDEVTARLAEMVNPEFFQVYIVTDRDLEDGLTAEETIRLKPKLRLVERLSTRLAAAMVKGTIKYPEEQEGRTVEEWLEHLMDDLGDSLNFAALFEKALGKLLEEQKKS